MSQESDLGDDIVQKCLEKILFDDCEPCTLLKLSRRANCVTTQAYRCMDDFYSMSKKKHTNLRPVHIVKGFTDKDGITVEVTRLVEKEDLEDAINSLETGEDRGIYALSVGPIEDIQSLLRSDHVESPQYQYADARLAAVDGEELMLIFRSQMSEDAEAERAAAAAASEAYILELKAQEAKKKPKKTETSIQAMFEKAQQKTASPQKPKPLPKSPFDSPVKEKNPTPPKKRSRKIVVESDDEELPPQKISVSKLKEMTPTRQTVKISSQDDIFDANDSSPEKTREEETSPSENQHPKRTTMKKPKETAQKKAQPVPKETKPATRPSPAKSASTVGDSTKKRTVKVHSQETVVDEDGFLVTRPAMVEMEVDDDKVEPEKKLNKALKPTNNTTTTTKGKQKAAAAPSGAQRSISSFFKKK